MEISNDSLNWRIESRVEEMRSLIDTYRDNFKIHRLGRFTDIQILRHIKKLYYEYWDDLHYDMIEYENKFCKLRKEK